MKTRSSFFMDSPYYCLVPLDTFFYKQELFLKQQKTLSLLPMNIWIRKIFSIVSIIH